MRPIIYLDVDGVLNFDRKFKDSFDKKVIFSDDEYYTVRLCKTHGQWLLDLSEETGAELVWATTWMKHANKEIGPEIGLPEIPYVDFGPRKFTQSSASWKANGVVEHHKGRPFLWFDDDFMIPRILSYSVTVPHKVHLVSDWHGLTWKDITEAKQWLTALPDS